MVCVCQERRQSVRKKLEDRLAESGSQHEESYDELSEDANNDRLPVDVLSVPAGGIKPSQEDEISEDADGSVTTLVVLRFSWDEDTEEKSHYDNSSSGDGTTSLGHGLFHYRRTMTPSKL